MQHLAHTNSRQGDIGRRRGSIMMLDGVKR